MTTFELMVILLWIVSFLLAMVIFWRWHSIQALKVHCMSEGTANMRLQTESQMEISKSLKSMDETQAMIQACLSKLHASSVVSNAHLFKALVSIDETLIMDKEERKGKRMSRLAEMYTRQEDMAESRVKVKPLPDEVREEYEEEKRKYLDDLRCPRCSSENIAISSWGQHSCDECGAEWRGDGKFILKGKEEES